MPYIFVEERGSGWFFGREVGGFGERFFCAMGGPFPTEEIAEQMKGRFLAEVEAKAAGRLPEEAGS